MKIDYFEKIDYFHVIWGKTRNYIISTIGIIIGITIGMTSYDVIYIFGPLKIVNFHLAIESSKMHLLTYFFFKTGYFELNFTDFETTIHHGLILVLTESSKMCLFFSRKY